MIELCAVEYLNTKPFLEGITNKIAAENITVHLKIPSQCTEAFKKKECDIALIPVGSLIDFNEIHVLDKHCIGADGKVDSVFIFSQNPIEEIDNVILDFHSRSSNALSKVLMKNHWKKEVNFIQADEKYISEIKGKTAGVVIGDRAIAEKSNFKYVYDLAEEWKKMTDLPFVFAIWVFRPQLFETDQLKSLQNAFDFGIHNMDSIAEKWAKQFQMSTSDVQSYFKNSIDYNFDEKKQIALRKYLKFVSEMEKTDLPQIEIHSV